jgi:hypothetical protein
MMRGKQTMKMSIKLPILTALLCLSSMAHSQGYAASMCEAYKRSIGDVFDYQRSGIPIDSAKEIAGIADEYGVRRFLERFIEAIYRDPDAARAALNSGEFEKRCIAAH